MGVSNLGESRVIVPGCRRELFVKRCRFFQERLLLGRLVRLPREPVLDHARRHFVERCASSRRAFFSATSALPLSSASRWARIQPHVVPATPMSRAMRIREPAPARVLLRRRNFPQPIAADGGQASTGSSVR